MEGVARVRGADGRLSASVGRRGFSRKRSAGAPITKALVACPETVLELEEIQGCGQVRHQAGT